MRRPALLALAGAALIAASSPVEAHGSKRGRDCAPLHSALQDGLRLASKFGRVVITSVCTGRHARHSYHYRTNGGRSMAVDFRVRGDWRGAALALRSFEGGFAHYGGGLFHLDVGPRRRW
jgi:threonine dehydrogenase-like Zn-dependent dehydrogenase